MQDGGKIGEDVKGEKMRGGSRNDYQRIKKRYSIRETREEGVGGIRSGDDRERDEEKRKMRRGFSIWETKKGRRRKKDKRGW